MHWWIIPIGFTQRHVLPHMVRLRDRVTRPVCCMDADGLFMGDATLRKIFCLQETLRGVRGRPPLTESLLQPDRVLFLPSPLLREQRAVLETPDKQAGYHLTPTLFQLLTNGGTHTFYRHIRPTPPLRGDTGNPTKASYQQPLWGKPIKHTAEWHVPAVGPVSVLIKQVMLWISVSVWNGEKNISHTNSHSRAACVLIPYLEKDVQVKDETTEHFNLNQFQVCHRKNDWTEALNVNEISWVKPHSAVLHSKRKESPFHVTWSQQLSRNWVSTQTAGIMQTAKNRKWRFPETNVTEVRFLLPELL